jgi:hypothetical protein
MEEGRKPVYPSSVFPSDVLLQEVLQRETRLPASAPIAGLKSIDGLGAAAAATWAPMHLHMVTDLQAKCLDGTQAGYYLAPATDPRFADSWHIHIEGTGARFVSASFHPRRATS